MVSHLVVQSLESQHWLLFYIVDSLAQVIQKIYIVINKLLPYGNDV